MDATSVLARALDLFARGVSVIPVPPPRLGAAKGAPGDGKVPGAPWREFQDRLPTEREIREWFSHAPMNLAIVTGAISGVIAIDVDSVTAMQWVKRQLPYTPWQTKTFRGFHLFYRHPGVRVPNRSRIETRDNGRLALDVRGDGGFVIVAPSLHARLDAHERVIGVDGQYTAAGDWTAPRERVPRFWPGWIAKPTRPTATTTRTTPHPSGDVRERARRYLAAVPKPQIGAGSDEATLYAACRLLRGFALSAADTQDLLWHWAGGRSGWTRDWIVQKVGHAERYGTEPVGALR